MPIIKNPLLLLLSAFLNGGITVLVIVRTLQYLIGSESIVTNWLTPVICMLLFGLSFWIAISHLKLIRQQAKSAIISEKNHD